MALVFVLVVGLLTAMSFFSKEDGGGVNRHRGIFTLVITGIVSSCLAIVATAKIWFTHLWKKNSTHARHKQHSRHHPVVKEREYRKRH